MLGETVHPILSAVNEELLSWPSGALFELGSPTAGLKCRSQVTGQVTGYRPQVRSQATGQVTGHRSQVRSQVTQKTIGHWTKLFWTDVLLYKNKISQGTLMIFLSFQQY